MAQRLPNQTHSTQRKRSAIGRSFDVYYRDKERTARMDKLNAQFVAPGRLAFDIGAHVGDRTGSFLRLGARVVALEPQPQIFRALRLLYKREKSVKLLRAAVGATPGTTKMHINSANPTVSTLSQELIAAAQDAQNWHGQVWDKSQDVPVTTLDRLVAEHGLPDFVKIDVEGFELDVLKGLSTPIPALSFEFTTIQLHLAYECLDQLTKVGDYRFKFSLGENHHLQQSDWRSKNDIKTELQALPLSANSGDIFAQLFSG